MNPSALKLNAAVKSRFDPRDYHYGEELGHGSAPFDWNVGFDIEAVVGKLPVKNQGSSGSCGGQAWATYAAVLEAVATKNLEERSAKYIYAQTYYPNGGGSVGRDNANLFIKQGVARETLCPSGPHDESFYERPQDITIEARQDAKTDMASAYGTVALNINSLAQAARDNYGVIIGIAGQDNGTWNSAFPQPPVTTEWNHWLYVGKAKLINGKKYLGFLNSWGNATGEQGWQWVTEDYMAHLWETWTHVFNTTPIPSSFHYTFMVNLAFGQTSVDILKLQTALQIDGTFPKNVAPTGFYGAITSAAIMKFRLKYKISSATDPQGHSVGPLTRAQLNNLFSI